MIPNDLEHCPEIDYNEDIIDNHFTAIGQDMLIYPVRGWDYKTKIMYYYLDFYYFLIITAEILRINHKVLSSKYGMLCTTQSAIDNDKNKDQINLETSVEI